MPNRVFQVDAAGDWRVDGNVNKAEPICARDQAMRLYARDPQTFRHLALGKTRAVIQPRGPSAELLITFVKRWLYDVSHFAPCYFFLGVRFFS
jgi:hypothetical protein